jgi:hypothetical protein
VHKCDLAANGADPSMTDFVHPTRSDRAAARCGRAVTADRGGSPSAGRRPRRRAGAPSGEDGRPAAEEPDQRRVADSPNHALRGEETIVARQRWRSAHASGALTHSPSRAAPSGRRRRSPASSPRSASRCRAASLSSRACGRRSRTAGARPTRRQEAARSGRCARPIRNSSRRTRRRLGAALVRVLEACPTAAVPSSSATARRTRRRS